MNSDSSGLGLPQAQRRGDNGFEIYVEIKFPTYSTQRCK